MAWLQLNALWYKKTDLTTATPITDIVDVMVRKGLDNTSNTVEITLKNPITTYNGTNIVHKYVDGSTYNLTIERDDVIELYAKYSQDQTTLTTAEEYLLTTADVTDIELIHDNKKSQVKIIGIDKTYDLLNKLWTQSYTTGQNKTAPEIIQEVIRNVCETNEAGISGGYENSPTGNTGTFYTNGTGLFEIDARLESEGGFIQDARPDTTVYPPTYMAKLFKPVYEWINELSQIEQTNTAAEISAGTNPCRLKHKFYLDRKNRFHWFYPSTTADYNIVVGAIDDDVSYSVRLTKSVFDVINMVIFNAGRGLSNEPILGYYFDKSTKESRLKMKYKPMNNIGKDMRQAESLAGNITINEDDTVTIDVTSGTTSWGEAYSSSGDYQDKFFNEAKRRAEISARAITSNRGSPRFKGNITFRGKAYDPGELIYLTDKAIGVNGQLLRIKGVTHQIDENSWKTTLDVEEDEAEV